jgi:Rrf2 family nitric oxide-sensitive transcriptional repressor
MRLTSFTDFALRALMRAAGAPERTFSTEEIAREFGISRHHLTKAVLELARGGFVETRRGGGGGFRLARSAETITIGAVVRALEARHALVECFRPDGGACVLSPTCRLAARLDRAREVFLADLDTVTLAEMAWTPPQEAAR